MTALGGAESGAFTYDLNGNMIAREEGGAWYQQQFDADASGRLVAVTNTQTLSATHFVYDGDGRRIVTGHPDGSWTAFVGGHYEVDSVAAGVVSGTTVLQPGSEGQDSYVYSSYPSTNYGNSAYIYAGKVSSSQTYRGLLEFDLASIPADAVVDQATLTLFCRKLSTASATLYLYRVTKGWGESSVTWNSQPATGSQVEGTLNLATSRYQAKEVDLTALVQAWVEGSQVNQGVMVKEGGSTAYGQCYSSDGTVGFRPKLEVHWHQPPPQPATRSYYYLGSRRIAMQVDDGVESEVYYFHTDHLGSTSAMSNESGTLVEGSVTRYLPYGGYRTAPGANLTDHPATSAGLRGYTGHKHNSYIKLVDMKARWYSPQLGRFISADSIIPDPSNPQSFNRYSYVLNRPLVLVDPFGHDPRFPMLEGTCATPEACAGIDLSPNTSENGFEQNWSEFERMTVAQEEFGRQWYEHYRYHDPIGAFEKYSDVEYHPSVAAAERYAAEHDKFWVPGAHIGMPMAMAEAVDAAVSNGVVFGYWGRATLISGSSAGTTGRPGRLGGPQHRAVVSQIMHDIEHSGQNLTARAEFYVRTPGGQRRGRFVDVAALDVYGNPVEFIQVGRITQGSLPVARERYAISDIFEFGGYYVPIRFVPY